MTKSLLLAAVLAITPAISQATLIYDESVDGDIGFNFPIFGSDYSQIIGSVTGSNQDNFIIELLTGETLNSITLSAASGASGTFGVYNGTTTGDPPITTPFSSFSPADVGQDLLTLFNGGPISTPGQYLVNIWHNNSPDINYTLDLDFDTPPTQAPLPASLWLVGLGLAGFAIRRRRV